MVFMTLNRSQGYRFAVGMLRTNTCTFSKETSTLRWLEIIDKHFMNENCVCVVECSKNYSTFIHFVYFNRLMFGFGYFVLQRIIQYLWRYQATCSLLMLSVSVLMLGYSIIDPIWIPQLSAFSFSISHLISHLSDFGGFFMLLSLHHQSPSLHQLL